MQIKNPLIYEIKAVYTAKKNINKKTTTIWTISALSHDIKNNNIYSVKLHSMQDFKLHIGSKYYISFDTHNKYCITDVTLINDKNEIKLASTKFRADIDG